MRVALICPSNLLFMPYVNNYIKILNMKNVKYTILNWDRFNLCDNVDGLSYKDQKKGHKRTVFDYFKFSRWIISKVSVDDYNRVIVFGLQTSFVLSNFLKKNYNEKFIIDIRDFNKCIRYFNFKNLVRSAYMLVVSSEGYLNWLPKETKYTINHNTDIISLNELKNIEKIDGVIKVSNIGATRDYDMNSKLINELGNVDKYKIYFHGEGNANEALKKLINENNIENVYFTGIYSKSEEEDLYMNSDFINVLRYSYDINNITALPNRLYKAPAMGKLLLGYEGAYLSDIIKQYKIGLVIKDIEKIDAEIEAFINSFSIKDFYLGRNEFFTKVLLDNKVFMRELGDFISFD